MTRGKAGLGADVRDQFGYTFCWRCTTSCMSVMAAVWVTKAIIALGQDDYPVPGDPAP